MKREYYYVKFYDKDGNLHEEYISAFDEFELPARVALEWPGAKILKIVKSKHLQAMLDSIDGEII